MNRRSWISVALSAVAAACGGMLSGGRRPAAPTRRRSKPCIDSTPDDDCDIGMSPILTATYNLVYDAELDQITAVSCDGRPVSLNSLPWQAMKGPQS